MILTRTSAGEVSWIGRTAEGHAVHSIPAESRHREGCRLEDTGKVAAWRRRLAKALRSGELQDLATGHADSDEDPAGAEHWPEDRRVPAKAIRTVLLQREAPWDPRGLQLRGAFITGHLDLDLAEVRCPLTIKASRFERPPTFRGAKLLWLDLSYCHAPAVELDGARVDRDVVLDYIVANEVRARGCSVEGRFTLTKARLTTARAADPSAVALHLDGARIGNAVLQELVTIGQVSAAGCSFEGELNLQKADLKLAEAEPHPKGAEPDREEAEPDSRRARPNDRDVVALRLDGARVRGSALLQGLTVMGEISASSFLIDGHLNLENAKLNMSRSEETKGNSSDSGLELPDVALRLDGARIGGNASLIELSARGDICAVGCVVSGVLELKGASLTMRKGDALSIQSAEVGKLDLRETGHLTGRLNLSDAKIGSLVVDDDEKAGARGENATALPKPLLASGWTVRDVRGALRGDRVVAGKWLDTAEGEDFAAQPWHELAAVYDRIGHLEDATWMRFQAAKRLARNMPRIKGGAEHRRHAARCRTWIGAWWRRWWRWLYRILAGYGYYPHRAAYGLFGVILLTFALTWYNQASFEPARPAEARAALAAFSGQTVPASTRPTEATCSPELNRAYPCFSPGRYAVDLVVPVGTLGEQTRAWVLPGSGRLHWAYLVLKILAWLMTALLLAGVTGLLRKATPR